MKTSILKNSMVKGVDVENFPSQCGVRNTKGVGVTIMLNNNTEEVKLQFLVILYVNISYPTYYISYITSYMPPTNPILVRNPP